MSDYVLIEYSNSVDFGDIVYSNGFGNRINLDADVSKPEYVIDEDGVEDADGEFDPTFQKWAKKYSITFYAQEFLVDALTLMTLHDQIYVTLKNGESSKVLDAEVDYTWDSDIECWAEVVITFTTDYIIKKNCDTSMVDCVAPVVVSKVDFGGDDVYDADGAGADWWNRVTDPAPRNGDISFFYTTLTNGTFIGDPLGFYRLTDGAWVLIEMEDGQFGEVEGLTDCVYLVKSGLSYGKAPYIWNVVDETGGQASIFAVTLGIENMFFQVERDDGGGYDEVGDPALASEFQAPDGYTVSSGAAVDMLFKIRWYTHSCDYGYGNIYTKTIT